MSEARALTNLVGNGVATMVVSRWEHELDKGRMLRILKRESETEAEEPEAVLEGIPATEAHPLPEQA